MNQMLRKMSAVAGLVSLIESGMVNVAPAVSIPQPITTEFGTSVLAQENPVLVQETSVAALPKPTYEKYIDPKDAKKLTRSQKATIEDILGNSKYEIRLPFIHGSGHGDEGEHSMDIMANNNYYHIVDGKSVERYRPVNTHDGQYASASDECDNGSMDSILVKAIYQRELDNKIVFLDWRALPPIRKLPARYSKPIEANGWVFDTATTKEMENNDLGYLFGVDGAQAKTSKYKLGIDQNSYVTIVTTSMREGVGFIYDEATSRQIIATRKEPLPVGKVSPPGKKEKEEKDVFIKANLRLARENAVIYKAKQKEAKEFMKILPGAMKYLDIRGPFVVSSLDFSNQVCCSGEYSKYKVIKAVSNKKSGYSDRRHYTYLLSIK